MTLMAFLRFMLTLHKDVIRIWEIVFTGVCDAGCLPNLSKVALLNSGPNFVKILKISLILYDGGKEVFLH
jgi:hypothetical protein